MSGPELKKPDEHGAGNGEQAGIWIPSVILRKRQETRAWEIIDQMIEEREHFEPELEFDFR